MGIVLLALLLAVAHGLSFHIAWMLAISTRILMTSVIYQKILTLSQTVIGRITVGHIVNLASNDVHKYELGLLDYHFLWINPLHIAVVTYLLYQEVQWCAFIATILIVIQIPIQFVLARVFVRLRLGAAKMTDQRLKVMNEVISGIRVIKMYGWEYAFRDVVAAIRKSEVYAIGKYYMIKSFGYAYDGASVSLVMFVVFSVYVSAFPDELTPRKVFVALSLIAFIRVTSVFLIIHLILNGSDAKVAWKRIKDFALLDELNSTSSINSKSSTDGDGISLQSFHGSDDGKVIVKDMSASWAMDTDKLTLQNISFTLDKNTSLMAIVGSVGCGKSTLLQCILKELPPLSGSIQVNGSISYASQDAWIFSATIRENILFGLPYDSERYNAVIEACALDKDIETLPYGDSTMVGERGVTLSGGQKARVNLARAIYHEADIYLLDDPLSAVDAAVSRHIFNKCIRGMLSEKCVILVTHQIQYLNQCDIILELREGSMGVYGDPRDVLQGNEEIIEQLTSKDEDTRRIFNIRKHSLANNSLELNNVDEKMMKLSDIQEEEVPLEIVNCNNIDKEDEDILDEPETKVVVGLPEEERAHGRISMKTYCQYIIAGGGYIFTGIVVLIFILTEANIVISDWWITDWAHCRNDSNINLSSMPLCFLSDVDHIGIYSGLVASLIVFATLRIFLFVLLMLNSSRVLHNRMFGKILRAPILFFDTNPIGRVLNRFSKDVGFLDDTLIQISYYYLIVSRSFYLYYV
jgi:ATP-binding cassette subfamily C (CFTR/MRP) protein 4